MAPKVKVIIKDKRRQFDDIIKRYRQMDEAFVEVGVLKGAGKRGAEQDHPGNKKRGEDPKKKTTIGEIAFYNEFGATGAGRSRNVTIPERSFIRSTFDENKRDLARDRDGLVKQILQRKVTVKTALRTLGFKLQQLIKNKINDGVPPPNEPSTNAKKMRGSLRGPGATLIDSGTLLGAITYRVRMGDEL